MKKIILTGGGSAGHVTPNLALIPKLVSEGYQVFYIGGKNGMEKDLIEKDRIPYFGISTGKLRRYLDVKNVTDIFRVIKGVGEAYQIIRKVKPDVIFSKGGFVSVPVVFAARIAGVPAVIHESDYSPGLANRLSIPFADAVCVNFPETLEKIPKDKGVLTGTPIRKQLFSGNGEKGRRLCGFVDTRPVVLFMGGSQGSVKINTCLRSALPKLLKSYHVAHLCGKGNLDSNLKQRSGYVQFEYVSDELPDLLAMADIVVSRAGANTIYELLALKKPTLLIPLSRNASRGDQILNAQSFEGQGYAKVLPEEKMNEDKLITEIIDLYQNRHKMTAMMETAKQSNGVEAVYATIDRERKSRK